jgi:hypothetical protein
VGDQRTGEAGGNESEQSVKVAAGVNAAWDHDADTAVPTGDLRDELQEIMDAGIEPNDIEAHMLEAERTRMEIHRAALRLFLGYDDRPMQQIADELGVTKAGISVAWRRLAVKLGDRRSLLHAAKRAKIAAKTAAHHAAKKGAA